MILGFDIDGCINNAEEFDSIHVKKFCEERNIILSNNFLSLHHFGLTKEQYQGYMNKYFPVMINHNPPRLHVSEVFHRLKSENHTLIGITARDEHRDQIDEPYKGWMMKEDTLKYFERNDIPYDKIVFSTCSNGSNKGIACVENHIDIMLEDAKDNIKDISNAGVPCIIMKDSKNGSLGIPNTFVVDHIVDYFCFIQKLIIALKNS